MAPATFFARPALLLVARSCRPRYGAATATARAHWAPLVATAVAARRMLGSVSCAAGAMPLRAEAEAKDEVAAVPTSVPVRVAYELQQAGHRYLDVRTEGEFSGGHPAGALNIPYMNKIGTGEYSGGHPAGALNIPCMNKIDSGMAKNSRFLEQASTIFGKDDEIIIGCQSGKRSLMAATELCSAGFTVVTDIAGRFSAWRENGLPIHR